MCLFLRNRISILRKIFEFFWNAVNPRKKVQPEKRMSIEHKNKRKKTEYNDLKEINEDMRRTTKEKKTTEKFVTHDKLYPRISSSTSWEKVWDVREFIRNLSDLNLEMYSGQEETSNFDFEVRKARVASALSAFTGTSFEDAKERLTHFGIRTLCDDKVGDERADKIKMALKSPSMKPVILRRIDNLKIDELKSPSMKPVILRRIDNLKIDEESCGTLIRGLIYSRHNMAKTMSSTMLEGTEAMYLVKYKIEAIYASMFQAAIDEIDSLLILLLGDAFNKSFTEKELIRYYKFPTVTDSELEDWCWENY